FLQPDAIPESIFQRQHESLALFRKPLRGPLEETAEHVILLAIGTLVEFSFLRRTTRDDVNCKSNTNGEGDTNIFDPTSDMLSIHRVVQMVVRDGMESGENPRWLGRIVACAVRSSDRFRWFERVNIRAAKSTEHLRCLETIIAALNKEFVSSDYHIPQVRITNEAHLPHVRHIVAQLKNPEKISAETHVLLISLLDNTTWYLMNGGIYQGTEELSQMAVSISEAKLGMNNSTTALSLSNLAWLYYSQGKYNKAEPLYKRALAIDEKVSGSEHSYTANTLGRLAALYSNQGQIRHGGAAVRTGAGDP
ncbi:hypothetical protein BC936DRAFT_144938, partial [Jimgerdemannia flammicorona]